MDRNELARRLMVTYLEELDEHVATLNRDLLALEKNPPEAERSELLASVFRAAHSLKGASRAVDVGLIERACHALEDLLDSARQGRRELKKNLFSLLFKTADAIEEAGMRLREEQGLDEAPLAALLPDLEAFDDHLETSEPQSEPAQPWSGPSREADTALAIENATEAVAPAAANQSDDDDTSPAATSPATSLAPKSLSASSVRISADKLDTLLAEAGELLVARQRLELGIAELETLREGVANWRREWRVFEAALQTSSRTQGEDAAATMLPPNAALTLESNSDRIRQIERDLDRLATRARSDFQYLEQVSSAIESDVHGARMLPFAEACQGLERAIRDVGESVGKPVRLQLAGADVQVDRSVLQGLKDPLLHLVRNAVDHGIEATQARTAAGKNAEATITVEAALRGGSVEVRVRDDGGGIDLQRVAQKASAQGLAVPQNPNELARLIFLPAFSTAAKLSAVSGRGIGLDVVRAEIERLHGSVDVSFEPGQGTCFTLTVPLTLTTIRAVLVQASEQTFAIPTANIDRIVRFDMSDHSTVGGRSVLMTTGAPIALAGLARILGMDQEWSLSPDEKMLAAVLISGGQRVAFAVDSISHEDELTVKSLGARVRRLRHVSGATLLPSGEVALVLNVANLIRTAADSGERAAVVRDDTDDKPVARHRLLVVDDSVTSRTLLRSILDAAGYDVSVAVDGQQALEMVESMPFDLIVSDVDMPRLDGFQFTEAVRQSSAGGRLPIVLVTARGTDQDRTRGIQAGANAYIVKAGFDQMQLLHVISDLL